MKNVVDSSGWLEFIKNSKNADNFAEAIQNLENLIVPSIVIYEVYKRLCQQGFKEVASHAIGYMQKAQIIGVHTNAALTAANLSIDHKLPMADAMIYAIAQQANATLWTQDADFKDLPGVNYFEKSV